MLLWVNNDVPKYSFLSYHNTTPVYHKLSNANILKFDIELRDNKGNSFGEMSCPDFDMTLQFELTDEIEYHKEFIEAYNLEGYRKGHPF